MAWLEKISDSYQLSNIVLAIYAIALTFLCGGFILIFALFVSRITKSAFSERKSVLRSGYQKILNKIIVNETFSQDGTPSSVFEFYMAELRLIAGSSSFARQVLLAQIFEIKKNLTGNSARALAKVYNAFPLYPESLRKLKSWSWPKQALAIRELSEMEYHNGINPILKFLSSNNVMLRKESFMALVRLQESPLSFLNSYQYDISPWMRINIYNYLSKLDTRKLPAFGQWFNHKNLTVRLFSINMVRHFKQTSALAELANLLHDSNPKVVALAVTTLGELDAYQYRDKVADVAQHVWKYEELSKRAVRCLGKIGNLETDFALLARFLTHPLYSVRFETVSALKKFGADGEEFLRSFNESNDRSIESILQHFSEPLLE